MTEKITNTMDNLLKKLKQIGRSSKPFEELSPEEQRREIRIREYCLDKHFEIKQLETITELKQITENNMKSAEKQYKASQRQFWASIIISITALVISIIFAVRSEFSSNRWQNAQLKILNSQEQILNNINNQANTLIKDFKIKQVKEKQIIVKNKK